MSTPTNHWKLGLFVVVSLLVGLLAVATLGARSMPKETVTYNSYFDEAVTGLEIGSPVKFRGVTIGTVSVIDVAPDRRHVKVSYDLTVSVLGRLGIARDRGEKTQLPVAPDLRAQLNSTGITGIKYVQLDFFDGASAELEHLPFASSDHDIPTQPSSMKNIEASVVQTADRLPEATERLIKLLEQVQRVAEQVERQNVPERVNTLLTHADHTLGLLDGKLAQLETRELSQQTRATLSSWQGTADRVNKVLERVNGDHGLLTNAERASDALAGVAHGADGLTSELERTLRDVSEAANSIQALADALERQPDMLLKGRGHVEEAQPR